MTSIWHQTSGTWELLAPVGFPDEATLHTLVQETPQILPLAGSPQLIVLGREVYLGGNSADLIAIEPSGRLCVIEIKLARNSEARRAIVAQVLTYAAYLRGMTPETLEATILANHLGKSSFSTIAEAVDQGDQHGEFDPVDFTTSLTACLETGQFRLVLVLDSAPPELVRLCSYLQSMTEHLIIDLITVSAYEANGERIMVPQRVDDDVPRVREHAPAAAGPAKGILTSGVGRFSAATERARPDLQPILRRLLEWAQELEREGMVKLQSFEGVRQTTIIPKLAGLDAGLVTLATSPRPLWFWRSVWEKAAPDHIQKVESLLGGRIGQGNTADASEPLLEAIRDAYRTATGG